MGAAGQFGHHALRVHAAGDHMAVVAVTGNDLVALFERHLHADDDGFLADIKMAEAADQTHAVHLARLLLEAADGQHGLVGGKVLILVEFDKRCRRRLVVGGLGIGIGFDGRHGRSLDACSKLDPFGSMQNRT